MTSVKNPKIKKTTRNLNLGHLLVRIILFDNEIIHTNTIMIKMLFILSYHTNHVTAGIE